jgi:Protein of unknown function (DUF1549)/Protein of unknown function (DUF1553)
MEVLNSALSKCCWLLACMLVTPLDAQDSASNQASSNFVANVDLWVQNATSVPVAGIEQDSVLLRKLYLTTIGLVPTLDETAKFLADPGADRYARMVEHLLSQPEFVEHWTEKLDVMLMERRANSHIPQDLWTAWLRGQVTANRPLNHLLADLLVADGAPGDNRPAARFLADRAGDPNLITNDVGRIFFGRDIQCSQCHNHPSHDSYRQSDYQGLFGFVAGIHLVEAPDGDKKIQVVAEKSAIESPYESVFQRGTMHRVLPHLFGGDEFPQPWTIPGEDYQPAQSGQPAKPIHSRRQQLADAIRVGTIDHFNRNLANRIWSLVFGRGIVEPVDLHHADNPPLSEELLTGITKQLVSTRFDLRSFVRDLVSTQTFQRGQLDYDRTGLQAPAWMTAAAVSTEQLQNFEQESKASRQRRADAQTAFNSALDAIAALQTERLKAFGNVDTARNSLGQAVEAGKKANAEKQAAEQAHAAAVDKLTKLQAAAESSGAALQAVGQDAELAAAVELLKSRTAAIQPTIEPLQKTLAEKSTAAQAANEASAKNKEALQIAQTAASEVDQRYRAAAATVSQQRTAFEQAILQLAQTEQKLQYHTAMSAWGISTARTAQLAQLIEQSQKESTQIEASLAGLKSAQQASEQKLPELMTVANTMVGEVNSKKQQVETITSNVKTVNDAKSALVATSALLNSPEKSLPALEELDATTASLKEKLTAAELELTATMTANETRQNELAQLKQSFLQMQEQSTTIERQIADRKQSYSALEAELTSIRQQQAGLLRSSADLLAKRFVGSRLRPLSPEQIGWSFLSSTNVYKNYVDKHMAELEKAAPATPEQLQDTGFMTSRKKEAVRKARAELQGNINLFITLYGAGPGQPQNDFFATPDQALYANNGGAIFSWASASGENVAARVVAATSPSEAAEKLFLGVLSRKPEAAEAQNVEQYLNQLPENRARLAQELVWGLMASAEFRFLP